MANWNNPTLASVYSDFLSELKARDDDAATLVGSGSNLPTNTKKWNTSTLLFQNWNGASFDNLILSLAGGGTGSATAAGARTNLGLGTMATQADSAVNITGGTITGVNIAASAITSGTLALNRGGTGASLSLGSAGQFLQVNSGGTAVEFGVAGAALTGLNASNISSGSLAVARMPTGGSWVLGSTLTVTTFGVVIGSASGGTQGAGTINATGLYVNGVAVLTSAPSSVPSGLIAIFDSPCAAGWTRVSAFDGRYLKGANGYGTTGGSGTTGAGSSHTHSADYGYSPLSAASGGDVSWDNIFDLSNGNESAHTHDFDPPYIEVYFCKKD